MADEDKQASGDEQCQEQQADDEAVFPDLKLGEAWGKSITKERAAELEQRLQAWEQEADHGTRKGPFDGGSPKGVAILTQTVTDVFRLAGADVFWLAARTLAGTSQPEAAAERAKHLHRVQNDLPLDGLHLEGANLLGAHLEGANLCQAHVEGAGLLWADLEGADLRGAYLEEADLWRAELERANLERAQLKRASLREANLKGAYLAWAHLEGATLAQAQLERADLREAHLEGADFREAHLEGVDLRNTWMDKATALNAAVLDRASLDQTSFDGVNLAVVKWESVEMLGDEVRARASKDNNGKRKDRQARLDEYEAAVRAHLQLAAVLRSQGMSEQADRFTHRAQHLQRSRYRLQRRYGQWLFSWLLAATAGYGYRLERILISYALIVGLFAAGFLVSDVVSGQGAWTVAHALDALQISLNAIHGRVFFAQFHLDTLQSWLATAESIVGIVVEGIFVAMLIQRFFGK